MSWTAFLIYIALGFLGYYYFLKRKSRGSNYPPGPWGVPVLGHLLSFGDKPHLKVNKWAKKYGPVFSMEFGQFQAVVLSDIKLIRAAYNDLDNSGRPDWPIISARSDWVVEGVIQTEGRKWQEQRRFILRTLRDFGFGKKSMEGLMHEEIKELIETLRKRVGIPLTTEECFNAAFVNGLWAIVAGERFKQDDPELKTAIKHLDSNSQEINMRAMLSNFIPAIAKYFPNLSGFNKLIRDVFPVLEFLRKPIAEHKATIQHGHPRDFIDVYLDEIEKCTDPESSFYKDQGNRSLLFSVFDLFGAGAGTASATLTYICLHLAKWPHVQKKLQAEIDAVVGNSRLPSLTDRPNMPYTEAILHETLRFATILPMSIQNTLREVQIGGFTIPANTMIVANRHGVHFDKEIWGDPDVYRPERFIGKNGEFIKHEGFNAFSVGKRACIGEALARDELFLFITSIFQVFSVSPETTAEALTLDTKFAGVLLPIPQKLVLTERI